VLVDVPFALAVQLMMRLANAHAAEGRLDAAARVTGQILQALEARLGKEAPLCVGFSRLHARALVGVGDYAAATRVFIAWSRHPSVTVPKHPSAREDRILTYEVMAKAARALASDPRWANDPELAQDAREALRAAQNGLTKLLGPRRR
jgi:hypothetical protein